MAEKVIVKKNVLFKIKQSEFINVDPVSGCWHRVGCIADPVEINQAETHEYNHFTMYTLLVQPCQENTGVVQHKNDTSATAKHLQYSQASQ